MVDFIDKLRELSAQIPKQVDHIKTEEGTKTAMIMPFIAALGYNVFDPTEVTPEFIADVGIKKGEKVDYVILKDKKPIILIECKSCTADLDQDHSSQLYRYFSVTEARFGILTNGIVYRFFTDLDAPNKMDAKAFLEFDMLNIDESLVEELKKFTKPVFDVDGILTSASELKYTREIKRILSAQMHDPSEEFVKFFAAQVYSGKLTQTVREQFTAFVKRAFNQFINDQINERLKSALAASPIPEKPGEAQAEATPESTMGAKPESRIVTTVEELEGYHIVKSILREIVDPHRIVMRDTVSYCGILLDDNNRKPISRLYFNNTAKKSIAFFNEQKGEEKVAIETVDDIYKYAGRLKATIGFYSKQPPAPPSGDKTTPSP